jgi:hypothetical protein
LCDFLLRFNPDPLYKNLELSLSLARNCRLQFFLDDGLSPLGFQINLGDPCNNLVVLGYCVAYNTRDAVKRGVSHTSKAFKRFLYLLQSASRRARIPERVLLPYIICEALYLLLQHHDGRSDANPLVAQAPALPGFGIDLRDQDRSDDSCGCQDTRLESLFALICTVRCCN